MVKIKDKDGAIYVSTGTSSAKTAHLSNRSSLQILKRYFKSRNRIMIIVDLNRTDTLIDTLIALWETSVRATHHFLTDDDIQKLIPFVKMGVSGIETLIVASDDNHAPI